MTSPDNPTADAESEPSARFEDLGIDPLLVQAVHKLGFKTPTPIQIGAIPPLVDGKDVVARARTGSGKTAAFALPLLNLLKDGGPRVRGLVLTPTRELAIQVTGAIRDYARGLPVKVVTIYGGASYTPQLKALKTGVPVVVGTPGRVIDLLDRGALDLSAVEMLVLDEADEMLRMGFLEEVERVLKATPKTRQVALFSATMPAPIRKVAEGYLRSPIEIQVERANLTTEHIGQRWLLVPQRNKTDALIRILSAEPRGTTLVFARTRAGCADVADELAKAGFSADALHGDLNQGARERVLLRMRAQRLNVVVATDVAARGIDVEHITHVINLDLPPDHESYVHRIGRTGRAGRVGKAITFVTPQERRRIRHLEQALNVRIESMDPPSDADIASHRTNQLKQRVLDAAKGEIPEPVAVFTKDLLTTTDPEDLARAAIHLLAKELGLNLREAPDKQAPSWDRGRTAPRDDAPTSDEVELFFPVGSTSGVRPQDLVGALANDAGVPGPRIGRITVLPHKSFVRLPKDVGTQVLKHSGKLNLRGREVPMALARPRMDPAARSLFKKKPWPGERPAPRGKFKPKHPRFRPKK